MQFPHGIFVETITSSLLELRISERNVFTSFILTALKNIG